MSKKTNKDVPQKMWICVAENNHFHYNTLAYTKKDSIRKEVEYAQEVIQPNFEWEGLVSWDFKCVMNKCRLVRVQVCERRLKSPRLKYIPSITINPESKYPN